MIRVLNFLMRFRVLAVAAALIGLALALQPVSTAYGANITVETTVDEYNINGLCSLREAVYAANRNTSNDCPAGSDHQIDAIYLANGATYTLTRAGSDDTGLYGDLDIVNNSTSLDIFFFVPGGGTATIRQNANPDDRVFHVIGTQTQVMFSYLNIEGGSTSGNGGGIYNEGRVTLDRARVQNNSAGRGGGVYSVGRLTVQNYSGIMSNSVTDHGGGVYNIGTLIVKQESFFLSNTATNHGGGIYNNGGSLTLENIYLQRNSVSQRGGGIYNTGASASVSMTETSFLENTAGTRGGGLYNAQGTITIVQGWITANNAPTGGAIYNQSSSVGPNTISMSESCLQFNGGGSIDIYNGAATTLNAQNNWWGNADGAVEFATGDGTSVSGLISTSPWLLIPPDANCYGQLLRTAEMQADSDSNGVPDHWIAATPLNPAIEGLQCEVTGLCFLRLAGDGTAKQVTQTVSYSGVVDDMYLLHARVRANGIPSGAVARVSMTITYTDGSTETCELSTPIPAGTYDWAAFSFGLNNCVANTTYTTLHAVIQYQAPGGTIDFDYIVLRVV